MEKLTKEEIITIFEQHFNISPTDEEYKYINLVEEKIAMAYADGFHDGANSSL